MMGQKPACRNRCSPPIQGFSQSHRLAVSPCASTLMIRNTVETNTTSGLRVGSCDDVCPNQPSLASRAKASPVKLLRGLTNRRALRQAARQSGG